MERASSTKLAASRTALMEVLLKAISALLESFPTAGVVAAHQAVCAIPLKRLATAASVNAADSHMKEATISKMEVLRTDSVAAPREGTTEPLRVLAMTSATLEAANLERLAASATERPPPRAEASATLSSKVVSASTVRAADFRMNLLRIRPVCYTRPLGGG